MNERGCGIQVAEVWRRGRSLVVGPRRHPVVRGRPSSGGAGVHPVAAGGNTAVPVVLLLWTLFFS